MRKVLKFGWSSLATGPIIQQAANIIISDKEKYQSEIVVVVSAMAWVTWLLRKYSTTPSEAADILMELKRKHADALRFLLSQQGSNRISLFDQIRWDQFEPIFTSLVDDAQKLNSIHQSFATITDMETTPQDQEVLTHRQYIMEGRIQARIWYVWEILSALLMTEAIRGSHFASEMIYSSLLIKTLGGDPLHDRIDFVATQESVQSFFTEYINFDTTIPVMTGYAWGTKNNEVQLLGRSGSDYVATWLASALPADVVEVWKESAVFSWDPRKITHPVFQPVLTFTEGVEIASSGAEFLHPSAAIPAQKKNIPIWIKDINKPEGFGTCISDQEVPAGVRSINLNTQQLLITVQDPDMVGEVGYIHGITQLLKEEHISFDSWSSSETSFTFSIQRKDLTPSVEARFHDLHHNGAKILFSPSVAKISIVGKDIGKDGQLLSIIFGTMSWYRIHAISKSDLDTNLTLFVPEDDGQILYQKLHDALFVQ